MVAIIQLKMYHASFEKHMTYGGHKCLVFRMKTVCWATNK